MPIWNLLTLCDGRGTPDRERGHAADPDGHGHYAGAELFEEIDDELVIAASPVARPSRPRRTAASLLCSIPSNPFARRETVEEKRRRETVAAMEDHPLRLGSVLGTGEYSTVYEGFFGKQRVACKVIQPQKKANHGRDCRHDFDEEVEILERVEHPHCLQLLGTQELTIVTEIATGQTLASILYGSTKQALEQPFLLAHQLAACVAHIHSLAIVHRDIKPENIMVDMRRGVLKLIDFGMAKTVEEDGEQRKTFDGSPLYASPEAMFGAPPSCPAEVWALGCVIMEMFGLGRPFSCQRVNGLQDLTAKLGHGVPPYRQLPDELAPIKGVNSNVERCFKRNPEERPQAQQVAKAFATCVAPSSVVAY